MLNPSILTLKPLTEGAPLDLGWPARAKEMIATRAPTVVSGVAILCVGWLGALLLRALVRRLLLALQLDRALTGTRLGALVGALGKDMGPARLIAQLAYYTLLLLTLDTAAGQLGLTGLEVALSSALGYLPKAFSALALIAVGAYVASAAKLRVGAVLRELRSSAAGLAETATEAGILLLGALLALDVLGVNLAFITGNLTLLLGAALVVVVFLSCWAMRHPAEELIANYYLRRMLSVGDHVQTKTHQGTVLEFVPLGLMLRDATGDEHFVPARELVNGLRRRPGMAPD